MLLEGPPNRYHGRRELPTRNPGGETHEQAAHRGLPEPSELIVKTYDEQQNELTDRYNELISERNQLVSIDNPTAGQRERIANLDRGIERVTEQITELRESRRSELLAQAERLGSRATEPGSDNGTPIGGTRRTVTGRPFSEQRREAFDVLQRSDTIDDRLEQRVAELIESDDTPMTSLYTAAAADPDYARAFAKLCRDPLNGHRSFTTAELGAYQRADHALRALNLSNSAAMVPTHLDANILLSNDGVISPFRQVARVESGVHSVWQGVSSAGVTSEWTAEEAEVADNSPTFATPTATAYKATSFVPISFEALGDMALDGIGGAAVGHGSGQLGDLFADARATHEATAFVSGNGTSQPRGLITALAANTNSQVDNAASNVVSSTDVYKMLQELPPRFRQRARWAANIEVLNVLEQEETGNGARLFPGLSNSEPTMVRRPVHEISEMAGINVASETFPLVIGDFRHYLIYNRVPSQLELVPHLFGTTNGRPTGQRGFLYWYRVGANVLLDQAFRALASATN